MCLIFVLLLLLPLLGRVSALFDPKVTVTCNFGPSYTVDLMFGSETGVIYIDGKCAAQSTTVNGSYTFNATSCTEVPALESTFKVVVQEYSSINLATDKIVKVTCNLNTAAQTKQTNFNVTGNDFDVESTVNVVPTFTVKFLSPNGSEFTGGEVGEPVQVVLDIPSTEAAVFDYQISKLNVAAGGNSTATMIDNGCAQYQSLFGQPTAQAGGSLSIGFNLFIPKEMTSESPGVPGPSSTTLTFTFDIEVCKDNCTEPDCRDKKRKRSVSNMKDSTFSLVKLTATLIVYPPGHKRNAIRPYTGHKSRTVRSTAENKNIVDEEAGLTRTPIIGILAGLSVALVVCLALTAIMFCKPRRPASDESKMNYSNSG